MTDNNKKILEDIKTLREQYDSKVQSWGRSDADKWFDTQVMLSLDEKLQEERERVIVEIEKDINQLSERYELVHNGNTVYRDIDIFHILESKLKSKENL